MSGQQGRYAVRCEWGAQGFDQLHAECDVVIIVDVLSFSTCVDVAVSRGARIWPYPWKDGTAEDFARKVRASVAAPARRRKHEGYSLLPSSLVEAPSGLRLVLPSPNGGALLYAARNDCTFTACLRNARAVARAAATQGATFAVVPAGEKWPDGSLRPALEDLLGAGAVLTHLPGSRSPEAELAVRAFRAYEHDLNDALVHCVSGQELMALDHMPDLLLAADLDVSQTAPRLVAGAFDLGASG